MSKVKSKYRNYIIVFLALTICFLFAKMEVTAASANEKKAFAFFTETMGLKPAAACGIMANINAESRFVANITGPGGSYGICQWLGVRKTRLQNYCSSRGYNYTSLDGQLRFLQYELKNTFPGVNSYLKKVSNTSSGAYNAAYYFCYHFEAPFNKASASSYRGSLAKSTYWKNMGASAVYLNASATGTGIKLSWNGNSKYKYKVYRSTSQNKGYQVIATVAAGAGKSYTDKSGETGKKYYYYILPINSKGKAQAKSNKVSVTVKPSLQDENCSITLSTNVYTYDGKAKKPKVTVTYGGKKLTAGSHYTVTYSNNKNAGTASVKVTGKGKYAGTVKGTYRIEKAAQNIKAVSIKSALKSTSISVKASAKGKISLSMDDSGIAVIKKGKLYLQKPGIAKITINAATARNYRQASKTITLTVTPAKPVITGLSNSKEGSVTVKWKKTANLSGYQIQYVQGTKFSGKIISVSAAGNIDALDVQKLQKSKTYSFRMRSYVEVDGQKLYSSWSKTKKLKLKK